MDDVRIAPGVVVSMIEHARRDAPNECCGLLVAGASGVVDEAIATTNELASPTRYRVAPAEHFAVIRGLRGSDRAIVGSYHSHPASPAVPSPTDLAEAWETEFLYVIVSLQDESRPDVRAYRVAGGKFVPVKLQMVGQFPPMPG